MLVLSSSIKLRALVLFYLLEDKRESAGLPLCGRHIHSLHAVDIELPRLDGPGQVLVTVHTHIETLDLRGRTTRNLQHDQRHRLKQYDRESKTKAIS